ncbi:hypothetical protein QBC44DRAFT_302656 [Cladorrhinum sp. PSN332]|nr:hypothetical protein QBC44DRAFT_302656 [Cladorrhinum sp. PSN332]
MKSMRWAAMLTVLAILAVAALGAPTTRNLIHDTSSASPGLMAHNIVARDNIGPFTAGQLIGLVLGCVAMLVLLPFLLWLCVFGGAQEDQQYENEAPFSKVEGGFHDGNKRAAIGAVDDELKQS